MISVIIALYNAENVIGRCLESVYKSSFKDYEVIVVDDCSTDNSSEIARRFPCKLFNISVNSGPAHARNFGVEQSKGDILFFIDSDTELDKEALGLINETFKQENDLAAIVGLPEKRSLGQGMASAYNALKNHYTLATAGRYCDYFTTQVGAVRRKTFLEIGGFDSSFRGADGEDIEFGLGLPKGGTIIHKDVLVGHHFPGFISIAKKYFRRSILLARVVKRNKKMAGAHASILRSLLVLTALVSFISLSAALYYPGLFIIPASLFALFLTGNAGLFSFISRERGLAFMLLSIFYEYVFSVIIGVGGIIGMLSHKDFVCHPDLVSGSKTMPGQEIPKPVRDDSFKV